MKDIILTGTIGLMIGVAFALTVGRPDPSETQDYKDNIERIRAELKQEEEEKRAEYLSVTYIPEELAKEIKQEVKKEQPVIDTKGFENIRLTSYYTGDPTGSGIYVGAGLSTNQFTINNKGWYEYKGKLVLAGATNECLRAKKDACGKWNERLQGKKYYSYGDTVELEIDNVIYQGIILDSCGACMTDNRIDLFVSDKNSMIDRGYLGRNEIKIK